LAAEISGQIAIGKIMVENQTDDESLARVRRPIVARLMLNDFRSYAALDLPISTTIVVLTGDNGAGKTNALEALSLLSQGRGMRRADLTDFARRGGSGGWAVSAELDADGHSVQLGTGIEAGETATSRKCRIDRVACASASAFAEHVRVVWLTPAMDTLFIGGSGDRRRFLDRLVLAVDCNHGSRVNALERALRGRNRLLEDRIIDPVWVDAVEREIAELAVAVAAARHETIARLNGLIGRYRDAQSPFPSAEIAVSGEIEMLVAEQPAVLVEESFRDRLRSNRGRDAAARRTLIGPHLSDLVVRHRQKGTDAAKASTGEQKALLVGLVLAHARLVTAMSGIAPLILLDEIAAHFDPRRRSALYEYLQSLGSQIWLTGADPAAFSDLLGRAQTLHVAAGTIDPLTATDVVE
jgi:DNA replication and repair protein RecF